MSAPVGTRGMIFRGCRGGRCIRAESAPGQGPTFRIELPGYKQASGGWANTS